MDKFWTIIIWVFVFVVVTGAAQMAIDALMPSEWVTPLSVFAVVVGWWVAEQVRKKRKGSKADA